MSNCCKRALAFFTAFGISSSFDLIIDNWIWCSRFFTDRICFDFYSRATIQGMIPFCTFCHPAIVSIFLRFPTLGTHLSTLFGLTWTPSLLFVTSLFLALKKIHGFAFRMKCNLTVLPSVKPFFFVTLFSIVAFAQSRCSHRRSGNSLRWVVCQRATLALIKHFRILPTTSWMSLPFHGFFL